MPENRSRASAVVVQRDHAKLLRTWLRRAEKTDVVRLASPWITPDGLRWLEKELPAHVALEIVFRWPTRASDLPLLDYDRLLALGEGRARPRTKVSWVQRLHAKVYAVGDRFALVTSGNLTKSGFLPPGRSDGFRNEELGVARVGRAHVQEIVDWYDELPATPFTSDHHARLRRIDDENRDAIERANAPIGLPPGPGDAIQDALEHLRAVGALRAFERLPTGHGRAYALLYLPRRKTPLPVRIRRSEPVARASAETPAYHFEVWRADVVDWWKSRQKRGEGFIKGNLFVPTRGSRYVPDLAPCVLVEFRRLVRRGRLSLKADFPKRASNRAQWVRLFLEHSSDARGGWHLRTTPGPARRAKVALPLSGTGPAWRQLV